MIANIVLLLIISRIFQFKHICFSPPSGGREASASSQGQWVYVSDTSVQTVAESRVLNSQAYLLFYEELP